MRVMPVIPVIPVIPMMPVIPVIPVMPDLGKENVWLCSTSLRLHEDHLHGEEKIAYAAVKHSRGDTVRVAMVRERWKIETAFGACYIDIKIIAPLLDELSIIFAIQLLDT